MLALFLWFMCLKINKHYNLNNIARFNLLMEKKRVYYKVYHALFK